MSHLDSGCPTPSVSMATYEVETADPASSSRANCWAPKRVMNWPLWRRMASHPNHSRRGFQRWGCQNRGGAALAPSRSDSASFATISSSSKRRRLGHFPAGRRPARGKSTCLTRRFFGEGRLRVIAPEWPRQFQLRCFSHFLNHSRHFAKADGLFAVDLSRRMMHVAGVISI